MKSLLAAVVVAVAAAVAHAEGPAATQWGKLPKLTEGKVVELKLGRVRIARETTRITEPLAADGMVDYIGAINEHYGKGVTAENNAFVGLLEAVGPGLLGESVAERQAKLLGVKALPPKEGAYFVRLVKYEQDRAGKQADIGKLDSVLDELSMRPWSANESTRVSRWIEAMKAPMGIAANASSRDRYFPGYTASADNPTVQGIVLPNLGTLRQLVTAFRVRAMLRLHQGEEAAVLADLKTAFRLARHLAAAGSLVERLVGLDGEASTGRTCIAALASGKLSAASQKELLAFLKEVPDLPDAWDVVDRMERYQCLDVLVAYARGTVPEEALHKLKDVRPIDFDKSMMAANGWYDWLLEGRGKKTPAERGAAASEANVALGRLGEKYENPVQAALNPGEVIVIHMVPSLNRLEFFLDTARTEKDLAVIALALNRHRADSGSYPDSLDALAGKWLERVPVDRFLDKPLRYARAGNGYLLYSVGRNGKDDGGVKDRKTFKDDLVVKTDK